MGGEISEEGDRKENRMGERDGERGKNGWIRKRRGLKENKAKEGEEKNTGWLTDWLPE